MASAAQCARARSPNCRSCSTSRGRRTKWIALSAASASSRATAAVPGRVAAVDRATAVDEREPGEETEEEAKGAENRAAGAVLMARAVAATSAARRSRAVAALVAVAVAVVVVADEAAARAAGVRIPHRNQPTMPQTSQSSLAEYFRAHQKVAADTLTSLASCIAASADTMADALMAGRKVIAFGNGGSATQASHLAGELVGRFKDNRQPFPAIALSCDPGAVTCISNDFGFETLFERQVDAFAQDGDIAVGLTTSGKSPNVLRGLAAARKAGAITIALTGEAGLSDGSVADHVLAVPSRTTAHIQEMHLVILHLWCVRVDEVVRQS